MAYGTGRVFERGGHLWVSYFTGQRIPRACMRQAWHSEDDAGRGEECLKRRRDALTTENGGGPQFETPAMRRLTIHDLLESHKAKYKANGKDSPQNLSNLKRADDDLGHLPVSAATAKHFREYRETRSKDATASVNRVLQMVRAACSLGAKARRDYARPFHRNFEREGE